jgi:hypothetical protein
VGCCSGQCRSFLFRARVERGPDLGSFCRWDFRRINCLNARSKARLRLPS